MKLAATLAGFVQFTNDVTGVSAAIARRQAKNNDALILSDLSPTSSFALRPFCPRLYHICPVESEQRIIPELTVTM